jgi:hypothetical protein
MLASGEEEKWTGRRAREAAGSFRPSSTVEQAPSMTGISPPSARRSAGVSGARVGYHFRRGQSGGEDMEFKSGDRVQIESESTERPPRTGVVEEVVHGTADPRYRIRWDDGHESIYTPAAGALQPAEPAKGA